MEINDEKRKELEKKYDQLRLAGCVFEDVDNLEARRERDEYRKNRQKRMEDMLSKLKCKKTWAEGSSEKNNSEVEEHGYKTMESNKRQRSEIVKQQDKHSEKISEKDMDQMAGEENRLDVIAEKRRAERNEKKRQNYKEKKLQSGTSAETIEQREERNKKRRQRYQETVEQRDEEQREERNKKRRQKYKDIQENTEQKEEHKKKRHQAYRKAIEVQTIEQREEHKDKRRRKYQNENAAPNFKSDASKSIVRPPLKFTDLPVMSKNMRTRVNNRKRKFALSNEILDIGEADKVCCHCGASMWRFEQTKQHQKQKSNSFSLCCGYGKVLLPLLRETPPELKALLDGTNEKSSLFHRYLTTYLDIVGKLIKTTALQTLKGGKKTVDILLANERDDTIQVTLWEKQANDFLRLADEYNKPNVFVIVTSTSAKLIKGEPVLWSSISTQYFFNIDHPDLVELRQKCNLERSVIPAIVPFVNTQKQTPEKTVERVQIIQLFSAQLPAGQSSMLHSIEATVVGIDASVRWYYTGCSKCQTKNDACTKCPQSIPVPLYRVVAEVTDSTSHATVVLFERHVRNLINVSAQHIVTNDKNADPYIIPAVLNNILGKRCVFKLVITTKNTVQKLEGYTVTEVQEIAAETHSITPEHDNGEPSNHMEKKRKLTTQGEALECSLVIVNEAYKIDPELEKIGSATSQANNMHTISS